MTPEETLATFYINARNHLRIIFAELDALRAENERLKAIVANVPNTVDGVPIFDGDEIYVVYETRPGGPTVMKHRVVHPTDTPRSYSTRELAEAAAALLSTKAPT